MLFREHERGTLRRVIGNLDAARFRLTPSHPLFVTARQRTSETRRRRRPMSVRNAVICMAVIDEKSFTRECIIRSLQALDDRLHIVSFATCDDCLQNIGSNEIILYHVYEASGNWNNNNLKLFSFRKLLKTVPVIILSDFDCPDSLVEMFENGARGFIPTDNTTPEQIIEIIGLVKVGGIFLPLSSLALRKAKRSSATTKTLTSNQFTPSELSVLDRLKLGKANKLIAHELGVSESTVKVHIGRIMKKLKVTNRTQIVSRAYALAVAGPPTGEV
jgi:DNA-binding NarL/FixJ family response regulator